MRKHLYTPHIVGKMAVILLVSCLSVQSVFAQSANLACSIEEFNSTGGFDLSQEPDAVTLSWAGTGNERLRLSLAVIEQAPIVRELAIRSGTSGWVKVLENAKFDYKIVEGLRRISNQQLAPLRDLGVELTPEVVDTHKWNVFWDAPLDLSTEIRRGNPPPAEGVADQPGLPRSADEIRRADIQYAVDACEVRSTGARVEIAFSGVSLGSFRGQLLITLYQGTNLIRTEVTASTSLPSVAYKYDVGISGLTLDDKSTVYWRDIAGQLQSYSMIGPVNEQYVPLRAANRLVVAELDGVSIAAFPPPHTFFWAREIEINVGYNWYRKDNDASFSFGIRQGEQEVVDRYLANWSLYSAPPGSLQKMAGYFYPTLGDKNRGFTAALNFTNADVYKALPGYKVMGSHYHTNLGRELMATGSMDSRLSDFEVIQSAGIDIAGPVDRPRDETQLEEQHWLFEGALRHSDDEFMVLPEMENSNLLGGHWDLLFSHPVYYVDARPPGTPLVTTHPEYGKMYNIGNVEDVMAMVEAENMLIFMPHPRTKGSTGYPDAVAETSQFLNNRYRGVGWRWGMGSDLSEQRLSDFRVLPLLDDMNNWIAKTLLQPKYLLAITETYFKSPGDDIYANGPVSYLKMDELPQGNDYSDIIQTLRDGDYFVTSGEVLIPSVEYDIDGANSSVVAEVSWTFPLDFVEVVYGDGENTFYETISARDLPPFDETVFTLPFDATEKYWVRFAAWDSAGNGAVTMPIRINN
ncbi:MAG: hypothetical protein QGG67_08640 [Gammaproteobacteria bacterium]|nr:hypothetical protein [Gammaproteobacteria bacterium]MDP6096036.1 hypothetical protein [Gammaproteobacteria bacterium]HJO12745.1 hypothetical protein [Gammaproteobacteria bacterium]